jgi:hypothetical protein
MRVFSAWLAENCRWHCVYVNVCRYSICNQPLSALATSTKSPSKVQAKFCLVNVLVTSRRPLFTSNKCSSYGSRFFEHCRTAPHVQPNEYIASPNIFLLLRFSYRYSHNSPFDQISILWSASWLLWHPQPGKFRC